MQDARVRQRSTTRGRGIAPHAPVQHQHVTGARVALVALKAAVHDDHTPRRAIDVHVHGLGAVAPTVQALAVNANARRDAPLRAV